MSSIRVLIVDSHPVARMGIRALLAQYPHLQVVAEADSGEEAIAQAISYRPDVVVMEVRMRGMSGLDVCRQIMRQLPATRVVMLTTFAWDELLFSVIGVGAATYVLKGGANEELVDAIEAVVRGESALDLVMMAD